jgi:dihydrofolate synthase/folylpolyglutamate synthase
VASDTFDWLFSLAQFGIKFGLDNIHALVGELGHPERAYPSIHVAGTNGKGSVTAIVETALRLSGHRTGRYTSPHLLRLGERIAIDGVAIEDPELEDAVEVVRAAVARLQQRGLLDVHPTFFEVTTATAFEVFRRRKVDVAVCEVGLGGRLDATNVLTPVACAITSIGFDHQQYLGDTLASIAGEKAGIIKPGVPVVVGELSDQAARVIDEQARLHAAPRIRAWDGVVVGRVETQPDGTQAFPLRTPVHDYGVVSLALGGAHQVGNAVVAVRLLETVDEHGVRVDPAATLRALALVRWPGRLERVQAEGGREALLDAAHNAAGADALAQHLVSIGPPRPLVFAAMRDKDATAMLRALGPVVSTIVITRASNPRSAEPDELARVARAAAPGVTVEVADDVQDALARAFTHAPAIVVAGSIFLLADVMKALGRS